MPMPTHDLPHAENLKAKGTTETVKADDGKSA